MPTFLDATRPQARKAHQCDLCFGTIQQGEKHSAAHMADDGRAYTFRSHLGCNGLIQAAANHGWGDLSEGWTSMDFEQLVEEVVEGTRFFTDLLDARWFEELPVIQQAALFEMLLTHPRA